MLPTLLKIPAFLLFFSITFNSLAAGYVKLNQINTEDGLIQNSILDIMQDSEGYLWIATFEGLSRYDGYRMRSIDSPKNVLATFSVELIWQDSTGLIWLGSGLDSNYVLDRKNEKLTSIVLEAPNGYELEYPTFNKIIENDEQDLWIATFSELYFYDRSENKYEFTLSLSELFPDPSDEDSIRDILLFDDLLMIATSNGLYSLNLTTNKIQLVRHTPSIPTTEDQNNVKKLHLNDNGQLLAGTVEGLYSIELELLKNEIANQSEIESENYLGQLLIEELNIWEVIEKKGFYWIATDKGLYKLTDEAKLDFVFKFSDSPFNTSDDNIVTMIEDREGNFWFGSRLDGVFKWHPNEAIKKQLWTKSDEQHRLSDDTVQDILQTSEGTIWIATANGLAKVDKTTWQTTNHLVNSDKKQVGSESTIYSMAKNQGKLWLNTYDGIRVYDEETLVAEQIIFPETEEKIFSLPVIDLFFLSPDLLAITTFEGIYEYSLSKNTVSLMESTKVNGDRSKEVYGFFNTATGSGDSYFISGPNKLWKFSGENQGLSVFHQMPDDETSNSYLGNLFRDGDSLWVTYPGFGVYQLDANTGEQINFFSEKSMGANSIMDIYPDKKGNLWFTSNDGLLRLNKSNHQVTKFGTSDGFVTSEFNLLAGIQFESGEVLLGSIKGAVLVDLDLLGIDKGNASNIHINGLSLLSKTIPKQYSNYDNSSIKMEHDDFGLKVEFSALLLDKPRQVKYHYWIEGDTKIEKTSINKSELFFPSFDTGTSTLFISAVDYRNGIESEPVSINIISKPAPWFSKSAIIIYILSFSLILLITYKRYAKRQLAKDLIHRKIRQSEERLNLALKGGNSGLWDWHAKDNSVYEPRLFDSKKRNEDKIVPFKERLSAIHFRDQNKVLTTWREFLRGDSKVFDVIYRMQKHDNQWQWYRDIAMVSEYDKGENPIRVTGTYTDITEKQEATEQIGLFSKALENARDIIIILNNEKKIIAVNQAFNTISNYTTDSVMGNGLEYFVVSKKRQDLVVDIFQEIEQNKHWEGEAKIVKNNGGQIPILINASTFLGNDSNKYFVFSMSDISKQKRAELELKKLVNYDVLTNLPNRSLLLDRITHAIRHCKRYKKQLAVFFVDLDRFKQINDTLGHDIGDLLLTKSANILTTSIREDDTVARIGGDEFVVMLEDIDSVASINRVAQEILDKMKTPIRLKDNQVTVSASIGISIYPQDASDATTLLKHADIAMYHAKNAGRNNFQYFEDYMNRAAKHRLDIETKLRKAVENNEFYSVYQPQFDIETGELRGVEALARWKTDSGEIVSPAKFIPVAEELGLIIPMTEYLLQSAMENIIKWNKQGEKITLAFNLSACHIYDEGFVLFIERLAKKYPSGIQFLEFELTESILMEDIEKARRIFEKLDDLQIDLALDDFGTGYSSLKYLTQLPIDKLKIDMSFVSKIGSSIENDAIIQTIISLAKSLNLKTVAEGIETKQQFEFLKDAEVEFAQGYLFAKPLDTIELEKTFGKNIYKDE